jgi:hypothetical protein
MATMIRIKHLTVPNPIEALVIITKPGSYLHGIPTLSMHFFQNAGGFTAVGNYKK